MTKKPMRTAQGRGLNSTATILAKLRTARKLLGNKSSRQTTSPIDKRIKAWDVQNEAFELNKKEERAKASGARMGRAMAAAKAKQKSK
jgi:hypothetical protein